MSLSLALPNGSMHEATLALFSQAFLPVQKLNGERGLCAKINDHRIEKVRFFRPQDMPEIVAEGHFDLAVTGKDLIREAVLRLKDRKIKERLATVCDLKLTKNDVGTVKLVLCAVRDSLVQSAKELAPKSIIYTEYPYITIEYFNNLGVEVDVRRSHGSTEAFVPDVCDYIVELVETGTTLEKNGLKIVSTIMETTACLIANPAVYPHHREDIEDLKVLLEGAPFAGVEGVKFVGGENAKFFLKFHIPGEKETETRKILPPNRYPTVIPLRGHKELLSVEIVVSGQSSFGEEGANILIPKLKRMGASAIIAHPISILVQ